MCLLTEKNKNKSNCRSKRDRNNPTHTAKKEKERTRKKTGKKLRDRDMFKTLFVALAAIPALTVVSIENATAGTRQEMTGKAFYGGSAKLTLPLPVSVPSRKLIGFDDNDGLVRSSTAVASLSRPTDELRDYFKSPEIKYGTPIDNNALFFIQIDKMTTSSISKSSPKTDE